MSVSIRDFGKSTTGETVKLAVLKNDFIEVQLPPLFIVSSCRTARAIRWMWCWATALPPTTS